MAVREVMVNVKVLSVRVGAPAWREGAAECFAQTNRLIVAQKDSFINPMVAILYNPHLAAPSYAMSHKLNELGTKWAPFGLSDGAVGDRKGTD